MAPGAAEMAERNSESGRINAPFLYGIGFGTLTIISGKHGERGKELVYTESHLGQTCWSNTVRFIVWSSRKHYYSQKTRAFLS